MSQTLPAAERSPWRPMPYDVDARRPWKRLPFGDDEYRSRQAAVRDLARRKHLDAIMDCGNGIDFANVRYLTGFPNHYKGDVVLILPVDGEPVMLTNAIAHGEPMHIEIYQCAIDDVRCAPSDRGRMQYSDAPSLASLLDQALSELGLLTANVGVAGYASTMSLVLQEKRQMVIEDCTHHPDRSASDQITCRARAHAACRRDLRCRAAGCSGGGTTGCIGARRSRGCGVDDDARWRRGGALHHSGSLGPAVGIPKRGRLGSETPKRATRSISVSASGTVATVVGLEPEHRSVGQGIGSGHCSRRTR